MQYSRSRLADSTATRLTSTPQARRVPLEQLEPRRLLAAIEGNVWIDADTDGLRDFFEDPAIGVTLFLDLNQDGIYNEGEPTTVTNSNGNFRFDDLAVETPFNPETGEGGETYHVGIVPFVDVGEEEPALLAVTSPGAAGRGSIPSGFNIDLNFLTPVSDTIRTLIESAAAKWEEVIITDLPNVGDIDDLLIDVTYQFIDGPGGILAGARPDALRDGSAGGLPYRGSIFIDSADAGTHREFVETIAHEIGHVLGFGSLWYSDDIGMIPDLATGNNTPNPQYIGTNGVAQYNLLYGTNASSVPLQGFIGGVPVPGSSFSHWDEDTFGRELMTTSADGAGVLLPPDAEPVEPMSRMTIGAIEDLGYSVSYAAAEPFGPLGIGALPGDFDPSRPNVPFQITAFLEHDDFVLSAANFGVRFNNAPNPFHFDAGPKIVAPGQSVRLLAEVDTSEFPNFNGDIDFRDQIIQTNFYLESNGEPGLQTPADVRRGLATSADTLLAEDAVPGDGFEHAFDTTGLADGEHTLYAVAYDRGHFTTVRSDTITVVSGQTAPERPTDLRVIGVDTNNFLIEFEDNATSESGYLLQVSSEVGFDVPDAIHSAYLPAQEGTGTYSYVYGLPTDQTSPNTTRHFRVRAFNTAGSTPFAGRPVATTLSAGEVLVDNADTDRVTIDGLIERRGIDIAQALTYLAGSSGSATYRPLFDDVTVGDYYVFVRSVDAPDVGDTLVEIFAGSGDLLESRVLTPANAGSDVLIGSFNLDEDSFVRLSATGTGVATADTVRFLPAGSARV